MGADQSSRVAAFARMRAGFTDPAFLRMRLRLASQGIVKLDLPNQLIRVDMDLVGGPNHLIEFTFRP